MNASTKQLGIKKVCKDHQAKLVCLLETKVRLENCAAIFDNFISDWKYVHNGEIDNTIRIWLGWDPNFFNVEEIQKSKQFIHVKVLVVGTSNPFLCTVVYALNTMAGRKDLWEDVGSIAGAVTTPWTVLGDFNWKGEAMTWNNRQSGDARICCKLDRVLVNLAWVDFFRSSEATFYPPGLSDHSLVVLAVLEEANFGPKPFRFFEAWIGKDGYDEMVREGWEQPAAEAELFQIQCNLGDHPDNQNLVLLESQAKVKLWEALAIEEKFLREKSRVKHIQLGGGNNSFFHKSMICRQNRKHILEIQGEGGDMVKVVSDSQSAFIKGRSIVDNILVCHDVVRGIERKGSSPTEHLED
ncbi:uncharacterized protein LOC122648061 [Telopea speciosissima]|uniref:uncharacterized protein LOC122648061 n=1 Tax=Telopea speciosissima TaxID=54955 RepID=UPI001CC489E7|nr:uncharacterized protein LOC122648061 [Telopea speciosissima]